MKLQQLLPRFSIALGLALLSFGGCTAKITAPAMSPAPTTTPFSIDIFSARGFLGGSEYERYVLSDDVLWRECGSVTKSGSTAKNLKKQTTTAQLEGNNILKADPDLSLEQRRVEALTTKQQALLQKLTSELLVTSRQTEPEVPAPGSFFSLRDPGLFEMNIQTGENAYRLLTSVDAVAEKQSPALERAHQLFAALRGIGPTICNAPTFFGIAKLSSD